MRARGRVLVGDRYKSQLERDWAEHLELLRHGGLVHSWDYEEVKLRLADGTFYTPDFFVVMEDGLIQIHEVKGHMREAARVRLNVAAERFPWAQFVLVRRPARDWKTDVVRK